MKIRVWASLILAASMVLPASAADSTSALADLLRQKGILTAADVESIGNATPETRGAVLARMLESKGVLTAAEAGKIAGTTSTVAKAPPPTAAKAEPEAASKPPVSFYGTVLMNAFADTSLVNIQDVPVLPGKQGSDPFSNDKSFGMTVRQSRAGLRFRGGEFGGAKLSGQVEFDFFGGKTPLANGINMDVIRLRLALGRLDWKNISLIAGQDWSVFAPLNPVSLSTFAIPSMSASGNPWIRTPQVRVEARHAFRNDAKLVWQIAATDPDMGDYQTAQFLATRSPGIGERGRMPGFDNRLALTGNVFGHTATFGASTHYGRGLNTGTINGRNLERPVDSWGAATDFLLPLHSRFVLTGEAYVGRALGIFSVAAGQSVLPVGTPGEHGVLSRGGWMQGQWFLSPKWQVNVGYGLDAELARSLRIGDRLKNQNYMGNILYKVIPPLTIGLEMRRLMAAWVNQPAAGETGNQANLAFAYTFQ